MRVGSSNRTEHFAAIESDGQGERKFPRASFSGNTLAMGVCWSLETRLSDAGPVIRVLFGSVRVERKLQDWRVMNRRTLSDDALRLDALRPRQRPKECNGASLHFITSSIPSKIAGSSKGGVPIMQVRWWARQDSELQTRPL
jgi:hypothetical protein